MKFFELYELPVSFLPDAQQVKKIYLRLSKKYHPDFYTLASPEKQHEILELSTLNTKAYQTLSNFDACMKYILQEKGVMQNEEKYTLPQLFLMEMLDLNELVLQVEFDPAKKEEVEKHLTDAHENLMQHIQPLLEQYEENTATPEMYAAIKEFYYKRKYLLRIQEQLNKFAAS